MEAWKNFTLDLSPGDPIIQTWLFIRPDYVPFLMTAAYLLFVKSIGPQLMKSRAPFDLRYLMMAYNFWLVITYVGCVSVIVYKFVSTGMYYALCSEVEVSESDHFYTVISAVWIIYMLKYAEYADTIFFVLRKKFHQITHLHLIHHALVPLAFWIGLRTERSALQLIPVLINSLVHILMYSYYGLAASGPGIQKYLWWKKHLTLIQMIQFVIIILIYAVSHLQECRASPKLVYLGVFLTSLFLILFGNFYTKTYNQRTHKKTEVLDED